MLMKSNLVTIIQCQAELGILKLSPLKYATEKYHWLPKTGVAVVQKEIDTIVCVDY